MYNLKQIQENIYISRGNSKLGNNVSSISLPPVLSCRPDAPCIKKGCYAQKGSFTMYPAVYKTFMKNWNTLNTDIKLYFNSIRSFLKLKPGHFRWHVAGDIPNDKYFENMIDISEEFPKLKFLSFTKQYELVDQYRELIPKNLSIMFSGWPGFRMPTRPYPIAWMDDGNETRLTGNEVKCKGHCEKCFKCWNLKKINKNVVFHKH